MPTNKKKYFCAVYDYAGKADPSKGFRNPKIKLGVATQILEIIKQHLFLKDSKIQGNVWHFYPIWSFIFSEKCLVSP